MPGSEDVDSGIDSRASSSSPLVGSRDGDGDKRSERESNLAPIFRNLRKRVSYKEVEVKKEEPSSDYEESYSPVKKPAKRIKTEETKDEDVKPDHKELRVGKYKRQVNSIYVPEINTAMIDVDETGAPCVRSNLDEFKYVRVNYSRSGDAIADFDMVRKVIAAVKKWPIIWDQRLLCHSNGKFTKRAWIMVHRELGEHEKYPIKRLKQIWKNKKDYYVHSTQAGTMSSKWKFVKDMEFYKPCINYRLMHSKGTNEEFESGMADKFILAYKRIKCNANDSENVLKFMLKMTKEAADTSPEALKAVEDAILTTFTKNFEKIILH